MFMRLPRSFFDIASGAAQVVSSTTAAMPQSGQWVPPYGQPVAGKTRAQVCLRWLVQQNAVAIPRTSKIERLSENIDIFDFALSDDEMQQIFAMGSAKGRLTDFGFAPKWD